MSNPEIPGSIPDFKPKSRTPLVIAALVGLLVGVVGTSVVTFALGLGKRKAALKPERPASSRSAKPAAKAPPKDAGAPSDAGPPRDPLAAKAASGDAKAVKTIEDMPLEERTAEQIVALEEAKAAGKRKAIAEMAHKIELLPKFAGERGTQKQIAEFSNDAEVAGDLVVALASLPGKIGPDLLYKIGPGSWRKTPGKALASDALYAKDVRPKASKGLAAYLDLAHAEAEEVEEGGDGAKRCAAVAKVLEQVKENGDSRSLRLLGHLRKKRGCGEKKRDDCWACLRDGDLLADTIKATAKHKVH